MKKLILIFILFLISGSGFSQVEKEPTKEEEKTSCYYVYLKRFSQGGYEKGDIIDVLPCEKIFLQNGIIKILTLLK